MGAPAEVVKGYFKCTVAGSVVTYAAQGVTKVRFEKQGAPGEFVTLALTGKSYAMDYSALAVSSLMGITDADWLSDMCHADYLCNVDNTAASVQLFTSRDWTKVVAPAAASINDTAAVGGTDTQIAICVNAVDAVANLCAANPCVRIGYHNATFAVATHLWTPTALASGVGYGDLSEAFSTTYTMPVGQNGCNSATHCYDEAGAAASAAAFTSEVVTYNIDSNGVVELNHSHTARTNNGVNAALMYWYAPLKCSGANDVYVGSVRSYQNSVHFSGFICMSLENSFSFSYVTTTDNAVSVTSSGFNGGADNFYGIIRYRAF